MPVDSLLSNENAYRDCIHNALKQAKKLGAEAAEATLVDSKGLSVTVRQQEIETLEFDQSKQLSISVFVNGCKANTNTSDFSSKRIKEVVKKAVEIARFTSVDKFAGLPLESEMAWDYPSLDLYYPWDLTAEDAIATALECEKYALKPKHIKRSDGVSIASHDALKLYGNSHGFVGCYPASKHSLSASVIAEEAGKMQRDYCYTISRQASLLESPKLVGQQAAKKALAKLNARQIKTGNYPVLFSPQMASGIFSHFLSAIAGTSVYRKASFLSDSLEKKVFPAFVRILEQPHIAAGMGSAPFDSEGVKNFSREIISDGILASFNMDTYSARKLNSTTTGNSGGVRNLVVQSGDLDFKAMLKALGTGLYVTELMGQGINIVTGDYSRGAAGFWVENGKIQFAVEEVTIASNLASMFEKLTEIGSDVDVRGNIRTGSILIDEMTVAGA